MDRDPSPGTKSPSRRDYSNNKEYYEALLLFSQRTGHQEEVAVSCDRLGKLFYSLYEYGKAAEHHEKALMINQEIGDRQGISLSYTLTSEELFVHSVNMVRRKNILKKHLRLYKS